MDVPRTHRYEKLKFKKCLYPECEEYFRGTGFSKYCIEHRKREYRKVIDRLNKKVVIVENPNQKYIHELDKPAIITFNCFICKVAFNIKVYPSIYVYPQYCEEHRNEYKRNLWIKMHPESAVYVHSQPVPKEKEIIETVELPDAAAEPDTFIDYIDDFALIETEEGSHEKRNV